MEIDFIEVWNNYEQLSEEEKSIIREAMNGPCKGSYCKSFWCRV